MKDVFIFSGTTEGRSLARYLASRGVPVHVSVATEYGADVMPTYYYRDDPTPLPPVNEVYPGVKNLDFVGVNSIMDTDEEVVFLTCSKAYPMDVDWVRIWRA